MGPEYNSRAYAVIPIEKVRQYVKSNIEHGRRSLDGNFLVWDEHWDPETLENMNRDPDVKLLRHKQALELTNTEEWYDETIVGG